MSAAFSKRFFHTLWRFNAIVIAAVALMTLAYGALAGFYIVGDVLRTRNVASIAIAPQNAQPVTGTGETAPARSPALEVQQFTRITGQNLMWAAMTSREPMSDRYYSKEATNTRDYVFYDIATGAYHRLLGREDSLVVEIHQVARHDDGSGASSPATSFIAPGRTVALLALLVASDSNGDGRLSGRDAKTLVIAGPQGRGVTTLAKDVERLLGHDLASDGTITLMLAESSGRTRALRIAGNDFAITRDAPYRPEMTTP